MQLNATINDREKRKIETAENLAAYKKGQRRLAVGFWLTYSALYFIGIYFLVKAA